MSPDDPSRRTEQAEDAQESQVNLAIIGGSS